MPPLIQVRHTCLTVSFHLVPDVFGRCLADPCLCDCWPSPLPGSARESASRPQFSPRLCRQLCNVTGQTKIPQVLAPMQSLLCQFLRHFAAEMGHSEVVRRLCELRANVEASKAQGGRVPGLSFGKGRDPCVVSRYGSPHSCRYEQLGGGASAEPRAPERFSLASSRQCEALLSEPCSCDPEALLLGDTPALYLAAGDPKRQTEAERRLTAKATRGFARLPGCDRGLAGRRRQP